MAIRGLSLAGHGAGTVVDGRVPEPAGPDLAALCSAARWATLVLAVVASVTAHAPPRDLALAAVLGLYALLRTFDPLPATAQREALTSLGLEVVLGVAVLVLSGGWTSPFLVTLGATLLIAGLQGGIGAVAVVTTVLLVATAVTAAGGARAVAGGLALQRVATLAVVGAVGVFARRVLRAGTEAREEEVGRLRTAYEVNSLLLELYSRVAGGPVALSMRTALAGTVDRLRSVLDPDVVALLLADVEAGTWQVVVADGALLSPAPTPGALPAVLAVAAMGDEPLLVPSLRPRQGIGNDSTSGIYASLRSGADLVGVLAVERGPGRAAFTESDAALTAEVARHGGLAIDNARWFRRLRTLGAAAERGRIARELHDRVGQSLAATGFALDGLAARAAGDPTCPADLAQEIRALAGEIHDATRGVREELVDLRSDTSPSVDLPSNLEELLERVRERSGLETELECDAGRRPPPAVEHEIWRIAQEAVINAERHSGARRISVRWVQGDAGSVLEVVDDGRGLDAAGPVRPGAFGLVGMRERADAIGGQLQVASPPGEGTVVRLTVGEALR